MTDPHQPINWQLEGEQMEEVGVAVRSRPCAGQGQHWAFLLSCPDSRANASFGDFVLMFCGRGLVNQVSEDR